VISDGEISSISVVSKRDDAKWFNRALNRLVQIVISTQEATTDIVGGATYSSRGIDAAIAAALEKAVA